ncbi:MAG TPA: DUF882 domain-containing protein [Kofleriaceae bacterium]|nr:DUF882 domain-containing protein [Kofleriaceae bacterium]
MKALLALIALGGAAAHATPMSELAITKSVRPYVAPRSETKLVNLYNTWTHEWLALDASGKDRAPAPADVVDHFLRCHYTNEPTTMDPRLVKILLDAANHFHVDTVQIVSGFRHPKYNLMLRKKGHQVARDSQHTHGNAVDFYLPGVPIKDLHAWAVAQKLGGVGLYLQSGFVHMDVGKVRYWNGD